MPLSDGLRPDFLGSLPFKLSSDHFLYPGIKIARNPKLLFKINFLDLIGNLETMIDKWKLIPLSLIGRQDGQDGQYGSTPQMYLSLSKHSHFSNVLIL